MKKRKWLAVGLMTFGLCQVSLAASVGIPMYKVAPTGQRGDAIGTVIATDCEYGLLLTPHLVGLQPGDYGFHIHENPSCEDNGQAAGGHLDPSKTTQHLGPYSEHGHLGDLPVLVIDKTSNKPLPLLAPKLTVKDILGHSIMIHEGGDNYSDLPNKLGGGGARLACGVIR